MEIITFVKAGLKSKKGSFAGFFILTVIIMTTMVASMAVKKNYYDSVNSAFENTDRGSIISYLPFGTWTDELKEKIESNPQVDHIKTVDVLFSIGHEAGEVKDNSSDIVERIPSNLRVFSDDMKEVYDSSLTEKLNKGEIYLSYGSKIDDKIEVGDKIKIFFPEIEKEFTIKGFVEEPYMGTSSMGIKTYFIGDEDFDEIYGKQKEIYDAGYKDEANLGYGVCIYPSESADESSSIFLRELNKETKIGDLSWIKVTKDESRKYTGIFTDIIIAVTMGFSAFLFCLFLIISGHSISTEMDIEYVNLGIMKSQGFTDGKVRMIYVIEYLIVEVLGVILGIILSVPLERLMSRFFIPMTSIVPCRNILIKEGLLIGLGIMVFTAVFIFILTRKIARNSPAKAITRGKEDVYFSSACRMPITKRALGFGMGLRGITSAPKRYISVIFITTLLVFAVITVTLEGNFITSDNAIESMGVHLRDIEFSFPEGSELDEKTVEDIILKYTDIKNRDYNEYHPLSLNGESFGCDVEAYPCPDDVYEGRNAENDNEIIITEAVSKLLDIHVGDTVTVGFREYSKEYVVVGLFQTMNDLGVYTRMSVEGFRALCDMAEEDLKIKNMPHLGVKLEDPSVNDRIVEEIQSLYGEDEIYIKAIDAAEFLNSTSEMFYIAADASAVMIYGLTFIFALITVMMVCTKIFIQERTDIGICHAIGFSTNRIRLQFAARFAFVGVISTILGICVSRLYSVKVTEMIFSMFGIRRVLLEYKPIYFIIPAIAVVICYMCFGYTASHKVKKISTRELVTE